MPDLEGRTALVTGAATGIGAATARALARCGARVAVNHLDGAAAAQRVVADIVAAGGRAVAVEADVRDAAAVAAMVAEVRQRLGPVHVLVNNAGVISRSPCVDLAEDEWDRVVGTNLKGVYLCSRSALPDMLEAGWGRIVNVASELAFSGEALLVHYCAAKSGVLGLTRALAREVAGNGVTVNAVAPGMTDTPMLRANPVTFNDRVRAGIPAGRWGRPEDVAETVVFLMSADYYVGWTLSPNGGVVM